MKYIVTINDKDYEVEVEKGNARVLQVTAAEPVAQPAPVAVPAAAPAPAAAEPAPTAVAAGSEVITAPMPGTILEVKTAVGAQVKRGDILVLLEAMKMENEIVAPKDGTVVQVLAAKGATVGTGAPLIALQ